MPALQLGERLRQQTLTRPTILPVAGSHFCYVEIRHSTNMDIDHLNYGLKRTSSAP